MSNVQEIWPLELDFVPVPTSRSPFRRKFSTRYVAIRRSWPSALLWKSILEIWEKRRFIGDKMLNCGRDRERFEPAFTIEPATNPVECLILLLCAMPNCEKSVLMGASIYS